MLRKTTLVLALVTFVFFSAFNVPVSQGQIQSRFAGVWKLTIDFDGPNANNAPIFTYAVVAQESPGFKPDDGGPDHNPVLGGGFVIGPCELGPAGKANGLTWRQTPFAGDPATGVSLTFDTTSRSSPSTTIMRGPFSADGNRIEGPAIIIGDISDPNHADADPRVGFNVSRAGGTFVLERVQSITCGFVTVP